MNEALDRTSPGAGRPLALLALGLGALALLLIGIGGPGTRFGWWHFRTGFKLMKYGAWLGIAAAVLAAVALLVLLVLGASARRGTPRAMVAVATLGLLLGGAAFYLPWSFRRHAQSVPAIHDITTDFLNPPEVTASRALRDTTQGMNSWVYEGDTIAKQQRRAYPDIEPVMLAMATDDAYRAALRAARDMGWEILLEDPAARRIEAVDVTKWYGFKDDVSIRVSPASGISKVDIRSISRVGGSDVGMNAARIRKYVEKLKAENREKVADEQ
ncbi:MAG: DUF1499 domain-containing protein [Longimicrobiaceae bacterium]